MAEETTRKSSPLGNIEETSDSAVRKGSGSSDPKASDNTSQTVNDTSDEPVADDDVGVSDHEDNAEHPIEDEPLGEELLEEEATGTSKRSSPMTKTKKRKRFGKGLVLEYDLRDMYPEMNLLAQNTKKEWNYHDPEVIRAIWLESKTNALTEWKFKHTKILKKKKPDLRVQMNQAVQLRQEFMDRKKEREKERNQRNVAMTHVGREAPDFQELRLPTNLTAELRYKFNRDNPPVPRYYLRHFEKYKRPPFKTKVASGTGCKPNALQSV